MNSTLLESTVETSLVPSPETSSELPQLHTVELAYVGGGMANFAFM